MNKTVRCLLVASLSLALSGFALFLPSCTGSNTNESDAGRPEPQAPETCDLSVTCTRPPPSTCKDDDTLVSYVEPTCVLHRCRWSATETTCPCADGACLGT